MGLDDRPRLSAAVTVLLAVAVLVLAWGSDSSTTARAAVGDATGPLVADSLGGGAILTATNMAPGDGRTGEITLTNAGDSAGDMALSTRDLANASARGGVLSDMLDLTVLDVTAGRPAALVYDGKLGGLRSAALGAFEQGESRRYRFNVAYPAGQTALVDDAYQGASSRVTFVWAATGIPGPTADPAPTGDDPAAGAPADPTGVIEDHVEPSKAPGSLKLRVYVRRTQAAHRQQVYVNVYCSHRCALTATGVISLPSQKKHWTMEPLKGGVKKAGTVKFRLPLSKKALPALNRALLHRKKASVKLKIVAKSGTQIVRWTRTIHLAR